MVTAKRATRTRTDGRRRPADALPGAVLASVAVLTAAATFAGAAAATFAGAAAATFAGAAAATFAGAAAATLAGGAAATFAGA
ncbi:hypothetical protein, partial [Georgenia alba]